MNERKRFKNCSGCLAAIGFEGDFGDPHPHGDEQPSNDGGAQRPQQLDPHDRQRPEERLRTLHVPDQHRTHDKPGKKY